MKTGNELKNEGIENALVGAEIAYEDWSANAYQFLVNFVKQISITQPFMAEDVRNESAGIVPVPPSNRAWGGIFASANRNGLIEKVGYKEVKNPLAHKTPATLWKKL